MELRHSFATDISVRQLSRWDEPRRKDLVETKRDIEPYKITIKVKDRVLETEPRCDLHIVEMWPDCYSWHTHLTEKCLNISEEYLETRCANRRERSFQLHTDLNIHLSTRCSQVGHTLQLRWPCRKPSTMVTNLLFCKPCMTLQVDFVTVTISSGCIWCKNWPGW